MRWSHVSFALAAAFAAAPAAAQEIRLNPEEAATLRFDANAPAPAIVERGRAEWTPFDLAVARQLSGMTPPAGPAPAMALHDDGRLPEPPPLQPDMLRLRFLSIAGRHSLLILENGYGRALVYRARIARHGATRATDVCLVMPRQRGFEHWPEPIERIELSDFAFVDWHAGQPVPCA